MKPLKFSCLLIAVVLVLWGVPTLADFYVISSGSSSGGAATMVFFDGQNNTGDPWSTDNRYAGIAGSTHGWGRNGKEVAMTRAGTIKNFILNIQENNLSSINVTITLEKNQSDTAITATYNSATSTGVVAIPGEVSYAAGDTFAIYALSSDITTNTLRFTGTFDIEY